MFMGGEGDKDAASFTSALEKASSKLQAPATFPFGKRTAIIFR
jgi:hypothetical protein